MRVLLSWSGRQSRRVAEALHQWLPKVLPTIQPWISTQDIDKGKRWSNELRGVLTAADACVVCLTPENVSSPWMYWETGAIALVEQHAICPLLISVTPEEIGKTPLVQFQCTYNREDDVLNLVLSLNRTLDRPEEELRLRGVFGMHWKELHRAFIEAVDMGIPNNVLTLLRGLEESERRFKRRWETDKNSETLDPIRQLVSETASRIEHLWTATGVERRIVLHCYELKGKVNGVLSPNTRAGVHERGEEIFGHFANAYSAIRADFEY